MSEMVSKAVRFSLADGMSPDLAPIRRRLSEMKGMYADQAAQARMLSDGDPLIYEFHDAGLPASPGSIAFGTSIVHPGKVGDEYFMTKGHFHDVLATAEVYYCLRGHGYLLMEDPEGHWEARELVPGCAVHVPERYAHRSVNVGHDGPLVTFFAFRADAGHDYGTIETKGFRKRIVERAGVAVIVDNASWKA